MKTNIYKYWACAALAVGTAVSFTACEDFFEQDSDRVIYDDSDHLSAPGDTVYSMLGILQKMQAIADRTVLLGEVRGDLVDVNSHTPSDLRDLSLFNLSDSSNVYNNPRDYYAVINNCNYFIAHVDTALRDNRNQKVFTREYAAAKTFRAWTYLQLVLAYGRVPFVTEPVMSMADLSRDYPSVELPALCDWFISDLAPVADEPLPLFPGLAADNHLVFFPTKMLLGDLCLWAGRYVEAARWYYRYITERNGRNSAYAISASAASWARNEEDYNNFDYSSYRTLVESEGYDPNSELMSLIACPNNRAEANYSQLYDLFNSTYENDYKVPLTPSAALVNLSESQTYCNYTTSNTVVTVPSDLRRYNGDLRLPSCYVEGTVYHDNAYSPTQTIRKYNGRNVHVNRRAVAYLRFAEAMNRAGYPRFAYEILADGVSDTIVHRYVLPYLRTKADTAFVKEFSFPDLRYVVRRLHPNENVNTIGIHSRGSGWTEYNEAYAFPKAPEEEPDTLQWQIEAVEEMIVDEAALELSFEGYRFYDLMRVSMHRNDPAWLAGKIYARRGKENAAEMRSLITRPLADPHFWYLSWRGMVGY